MTVTVADPGFKDFERLEMISLQTVSCLEHVFLSEWHVCRAKLPRKALNSKTTKGRQGKMRKMPCNVPEEVYHGGQ